MFKLKMRTDNQAFEEDKINEVCRILEETINKLKNGNTDGGLIDINGNSVGAYSLTNRK